MTASSSRRRSAFGAHPIHAILLALPLILLSFPTSAQIACGDSPKDIPIAVQEMLKGDVEGKAQLLTKMLGDAQLKGKVETSRTELHQEHKNLDQYQIDMYFMWVACQALNSDKTLSTGDKIKLWTDVRAAFNPRGTTVLAPARNPNALYQYGEAVAEVQGAVLSQANGTVTFQTIRSAGKADSTREVEYQDWVLRCPNLPGPRPGTIVGQFSGMVVGETCTIVGKVP
jgi:hypothetical protein